MSPSTTDRFFKASGAAAASEAQVMAGTLTAIHIYPVNSSRAVALDQVEIAGTGLWGDRLCQVVDGDGNPVTQRHGSLMLSVLLFGSSR